MQLDTVANTYGVPLWFSWHWLLNIFCRLGVDCSGGLLVMFLLCRLFSSFLFPANERAAVGVSSIEPTVNGLNFVYRSASVKRVQSICGRVDGSEGRHGFKAGQWTTSNISEHAPSWKLYQFMVFTTSPLSLILTHTHTHTHTHARARERVAKTETINKKRILLRLKRSSLESISTLASTYPWIDLSTLGSMDPCIYRQSIFRRLGAGYSVMFFVC